MVSPAPVEPGALESFAADELEGWYRHLERMRETAHTRAVGREASTPELDAYMARFYRVLVAAYARPQLAPETALEMRARDGDR